MLFEQVAPEGALARTDTRFLAAPQPKVFGAIQQVRPAELRGFRVAGWLTPFDPGRPLYAQLLGAGYTVLGTVPLREVVIGRVGPLRRPFAAEPRVRDKRAFLAFSEAGHAKVLLSFKLRAEELADRKGTRVDATLALWDAATGGPGSLGLLWPLLGAVGGVVSRAFLSALAQRLGS